MTDEWKVISDDDTRERELQGVVRSLSDWTKLDALSSAPVGQSVRHSCSHGERLMSLHSARRFLNVRIEDEQLMGRPTVDLENELETKRAETLSFLKYLEAHARAHP